MKDPKDFKVLIACEESQAVCKEFRKLGFEAYSNDIIHTSGDNPEWHLQMDCFEAIKEINPNFVIAFPPCTHLACSGAAHFAKKIADGRQQKGIDFFMKFTQLDIQYIAIENPIGIMSSKYRKPDQIIQPYEYGHGAMKSTCLWLKGLPKLFPTKIVEKEYITTKKGVKYPKWSYDTLFLPREQRAKERSKTFPGIAAAMANQWSNYLINQS